MKTDTKVRRGQTAAGTAALACLPSELKQLTRALFKAYVCVLHV